MRVTATRGFASVPRCVSLYAPQRMDFTMSCLERAIPDGHAKLSGEGEHARSGRRRLRRAAGRWRAMRETGFETVPCVRGFPRGRGKLRPWRARSRFQQGDANNDLQPVTVARASAPASGGSVPLPVHGRERIGAGRPWNHNAKPRFGPGRLRYVPTTSSPSARRRSSVRSSNATRHFGRYRESTNL
jgi:hypothetical protein